MKKITTLDFIELAMKIHGDKYNYSRVVYTTAKSKVEIICPIHGIFLLTPTSHLSGSGCPYCSNNITLTTEQFIEKARIVHNDKYDYSKVKYVNGKTKVCIICHAKDKLGNEHGEFWQLPINHIGKCTRRGCPKCNGGKKLSTQEFIKNATEKHLQNEYDYTLVNYINSSTPVLIKCNKCGNYFWQLPSVHLISGCPHCYGNIKKTNELFVEEAKRIHNDKYDYSKVIYLDCYTKVEIICKKCGTTFWQEANSHLQGHGCPNCATKSILEDEIKEFLLRNDINFIAQKRFKWLGRLSLDFYLPSYNCGIECQGKQHFISENCGWNNKKSLELCIERDVRKLNLCRSNNIRLIYYSNLGISYPYLVYENKELMLKDIINGL